MADLCLAPRVQLEAALQDMKNLGWDRKYPAVYDILKASVDDYDDAHQ